MNIDLSFNGWKGIIVFFCVLLAAVLVAWGLTVLNKRFFKRVQKNQKNLHLSFLERFINILIFVAVIILAISAVDGTKSVWQTLLGGTAVVSAVAAFAAQDVIKDMLAGLMISIYKPFDIGDRIELEDGTAGIVEDITMRHIVINKIDTIKVVIPNSQLNAMALHNYSYHSEYRSVYFEFPVGYDTDTEQAKAVIGNAIKASNYSVPARKDKNGNACYSPVYFIALADSALMMTVTVYYEKGNPTEVVKSDINTRVRNALLENNIEIPYNYITVVNK